MASLWHIQIASTSLVLHFGAFIKSNKGDLNKHWDTAPVDLLTYVVSGKFIQPGHAGQRNESHPKQDREEQHKISSHDS